MPNTNLDEYIQSQVETAKNVGFTCVEAEENVLRRMIFRKGVAEDIATELLPQDFSRNEYGMIFRAIQSLVYQHRQVDMVSIDQECTRLYPGKFKPSSLISAAQEHYTTIEKWQDVTAHVRIIKDLSIRRQAIQSLEGLVGGLRDPTKDISGVLAEIGDAADSINTGEAAWTSMSDVLIDTFTYIEKRQKGEIKAITSGLKCLDRIIGGFFDEEMTIVAARPSVGKSAFGVNIALAAANQGFKVGVVSCEMSSTGLGQRLLSHGAWVDGMKLRRADVDEDAWAKLTEAMSVMGPLPIEFLFDCSAVEDVVNTARKKARRGELDILIVDYLQFMETRRRFKEERHRIGYISHALKRLARRAKIPVIALAQVTREGEGQMPTMRMLRESGNIEQDADGIIFLHRPDGPNDASVNPLDRAAWNERAEDLKYISIGIAKQRNGSVGTVNVLFNPGLMQYIEILRGV